MPGPRAFPPIARFPALFHVGAIVADVDAATDELGGGYGLEPYQTLELEFADALVDGAPQSFSARFRFLSLGNTNIELIEPLAGDSPYRRCLDAGRAGPHHLAFVVDSIDEHVRRIRAGAPGASVVLDAKLPRDGRFVYLDGTHHGLLIELLELASPRRRR